jgi:nuclear cap-binding protein subunit 2
VRDEHRDDFDEGRGGWGARIRDEEIRGQMQRNVYDGTAAIPQGSFNSDYYASVDKQRKRQYSDDEDDAGRYSRRRRSPTY